MAIRGNNVLSGCYGSLRIENQDVAEITNVDLSINIDREDVQWGLGKDSKIVGATGEGSLTVDHVYTRFTKQFEELKKGKDLRFDLYLKHSDPDAVDGQIETFTVTGAWLNTINLGFDKSAKGTKEYSFGFNPMESGFNDIIK